MAMTEPTMVAAGTLRRVAVQWTVGDAVGKVVVKAVVKPPGVPKEEVTRGVSVAGVGIDIVAEMDAARIVVAAAAPTVGIRRLSPT
jgi:hypothetical protein